MSQLWQDLKLRLSKTRIDRLLLKHSLMVIMIWTTAVFLVSALRGQTSFNTYINLKDSEVILSKTVEDLKVFNDDLELQIQKLKTSKEYARKVLKEKYHVTEENEKIVYFAD